ncbi:MAG: excinuclease ABC subunit UvrB [bacterium]
MFKLKSQFAPSGDQPKAIEELVKGLESGMDFQTLLGVTGSGKTFTMANVIQRVQKPTLIIAHNKTLAAQLASEFRQFFPENAVEYFVSYYDYYQPEAYLPSSDTYIEKESQINEEIDRLRHAATAAVMSRRDVIIVASVSCIYGLGSPEFYKDITLQIEKGEKVNREQIARQLTKMHYTRSEVLERARFRIHGPILEIVPPDKEIVWRVELGEGDVVEEISQRDLFATPSDSPLPKGRERGDAQGRSDLDKIIIYPAKHFIVPEPVMGGAIKEIKKELAQRLKQFEKEGKLLEVERLERRTNYDTEMMKEIGYCNGIENYSRYLTNRKPGEPPFTLLDYFPKDFLTIIDESHVTVSQVGAMFEGDKSRKKALIEHGFRLPSAADNRPLKFNEFEERIGQVIFTSATPAKYERENSRQTVEQIIRPTGLVDPEVILKPLKNQVSDVIEEIKKRADKDERVLVTTLTKKMAEQLSEYLVEAGVKSKYLHSEVDTLDRIRILKELRQGKFDCLVGVNLLREGLDLPEVSLVAILDADKEGFLRSETSLIQTIGRAARNISGKVILYADNITGSMRRALDETDRRREIQIEHNKKHNITPQSIKKSIESIIDYEISQEKPLAEFVKLESIEDLPKYIKQREREMKLLAKALDFEGAALIRDEINQLRKIKSG